MHLTAAIPLLAISTCKRNRHHLCSHKKAREWKRLQGHFKDTEKTSRDFQSYFFNDPVATKAGDKLSRGGHGEVPLEIHLSVFTSFFHQVKTRHARPAVEHTWLAASSKNTQKHHSVLRIHCHIRDIKSSQLNIILRTSQTNSLDRHRGKKSHNSVSWVHTVTTMTEQHWKSKTQVKVQNLLRLWTGPLISDLITKIRRKHCSRGGKSSQTSAISSNYRNQANAITQCLIQPMTTAQIREGECM